jgi:hypothetical protein
MHCFVAGSARRKQKNHQSLVTYEYAQKAKFFFHDALVLEREFVYLFILDGWAGSHNDTVFVKLLCRCV